MVGLRPINARPGSICLRRQHGYAYSLSRRSFVVRVNTRAGKANEFYLVPADGSGQSIRVTGERVLGKSDFQTVNDKIADAHLTLSANDGRWVLRDLDSKKGTALNSEFLHGEERELNDGDVLEIGWNGKTYIVSATPAHARSTLLASTRETVQQSAQQEANASATSVQRQQPSNVATAVKEFTHLFASLGVLYYANTTLTNYFKLQGWTYPAPLAGMFIIILGLGITSKVSEPAVDKVMDFFEPALTWIQRWLPLFYVPSLVTVPLAIKGIETGDLVKLLGIVSVGMVASLLFTAFMAVTIRKLVRTEMQPTPPPQPLPPFSVSHYVSWGLIALGSLIALAAQPGLVTDMHIPFLLAATVGGLLAGSALPATARKVLHPIIVCAIVANAGAFVYSCFSPYSYEQVLKFYLTKNSMQMGAGDLLMSFLGTVILSFGFRIFGQRALMKRHAPEILGSVWSSALFSLFATATIAKAVGLPSILARSIVPRSVTVALAIPIAQQLQADQAITAAAVVLTGLLGANFAQTLLDRFNFKDPIARGLATAGSAHGLGTAALAAKEPDALPFCALAYALMGIISTVLCSAPLVRGALLGITG